MVSFVVEYFSLPTVVTDEALFKRRTGQERTNEENGPLRLHLHRYPLLHQNHLLLLSRPTSNNSTPSLLLLRLLPWMRFITLFTLPLPLIRLTRLEMTLATTLPLASLADCPMACRVFRSVQRKNHKLAGNATILTTRETKRIFIIEVPALLLACLLSCLESECFLLFLGLSWN